MAKRGRLDSLPGPHHAPVLQAQPSENGKRRSSSGESAFTCSRFPPPRTGTDFRPRRYPRGTRRLWLMYIKRRAAPQGSSGSMASGSAPGAGFPRLSGEFFSAVNCTRHPHLVTGGKSPNVGGVKRSFREGVRKKSLHNLPQEKNRGGAGMEGQEPEAPIRRRRPRTGRFARPPGAASTAGQRVVTAPARPADNRSPRRYRRPHATPTASAGGRPSRFPPGGLCAHHTFLKRGRMSAHPIDILPPLRCFDRHAK
jgi:hypothetical protein